MQVTPAAQLNKGWTTHRYQLMTIETICDRVVLYRMKVLVSGPIDVI